VTEITRDDLEHLFELRALLEGYAAQRAAPFLAEDDIDQIELAFDSCAQAIGQGQVREFMEADVAFHALLMERASNPRLAEMMGLLDSLTHREQFLGLQSSENIQESCAEHQEILKALRRQDGELAGQLMRKHLCAVRDRLVGLLDLSD
jgi:DNA-binding GntR family transcriptional regulator